MCPKVASQPNLKTLFLHYARWIGPLTEIRTFVDAPGKVSRRVIVELVDRIPERTSVTASGFSAAYSVLVHKTESSDSVVYRDHHKSYL